MKSELWYDCPKCNNHRELKIKQVITLEKFNKVICSSCGENLLLDDEGIQIAQKRYKDFESLLPYQLGFSSVILTSTLMHFSGLMPTEGLFSGCFIGVCIFLKLILIKFNGLNLTFKH
ncbi:hypothetical protein ABT56_12365 [Photobacterium aquae]|uniref:Uncharacterized protein n=1 Tax=Photobacterium aquae TaxID=1195763 RepID=A0A0J1GZX7_9GAMM|nr:hypothetical protein [Photobacterium aquae]KLV05173.1 hypothetical protein ABT56_12365 [Photobacterium aquae]